MKGIISSHSALNIYQRQTAVDPVSEPQPKATGKGSRSSTSLRAPRESEARALAAGPTTSQQTKVERLREAIENGDLEFDSQLIAERMIDQGE
jgi:flagellar biosynthesis anti-sigma factor FlgM